MEVLQEGRVTRASDVYSFAMVALEMITGTPVFEGFSSTQVGAPDQAAPRFVMPLGATLAVLSFHQPWRWPLATPRALAAMPACPESL